MSGDKLPEDWEMIATRRLTEAVAAMRKAADTHPQITTAERCRATAALLGDVKLIIQPSHLDSATTQLMDHVAGSARILRYAMRRERADGGF